MEVVLDHIQVLEATGMVDFTDTEAIPLAALAAAPVTPTSSAPAPAGPRVVPNVPRTQNLAQDNDSGGSDASCKRRVSCSAADA